LSRSKSIPPGAVAAQAVRHVEALLAYRKMGISSRQELARALRTP
jgi:hypothetical protein